jgi:hypothetical protein
LQRLTIFSIRSVFDAVIFGAINSPPGWDVGNSKNPRLFYIRTMRFRFVLCSLLASLPLICCAVEPQDSVEYLLGYIAKSDASFIRNGSAYSGAEAAQHLRRKYEYAKSKIVSADDFIRLCATKSSFSGSFYFIKTKAGEMLRCDAWLRQVLKLREKNATDNSKS